MWMDLPRRVQEFGASTLYPWLQSLPALSVKAWHWFEARSIAEYHVLRDTQVSLLSALGLACAMLLIFFVMLWDLIRSSRRDKAMDRRRREGHNKPVVDVAVGEALTEAWLQDKLSDKDYDFWCKFFAIQCDFKSTRIRKKVKAQNGRAAYMKKEIRKRLGNNKPVTIPGPLPGEDVPTSVVDVNLGTVFDRHIKTA